LEGLEERCLLWGTVATGADAGGGPQVNVYDAVTGATQMAFMAYDQHFQGGVRVAVADVNGDGTPDIITGPGPGGGPDIRVFDGNNGNLIREFMAFDPRFLGGVYVAAGDFAGTGKADIVVGADAGGGPEVRLFDGTTLQPIVSFFPYNPGFTGGVRVAVADVNGDGVPDLITGAGPGGGPHVQVFDGRTLTNLIPTVLQSFMAFDPSMTAGVYVAGGDISGTGKSDILVGTGTGVKNEFKVFSGVDGSVLQDVTPYPAGFQGGVRVAAVADINSDGKADLVTAPGPSGGPQVVFLDGITLTVFQNFYAYNSGFLGGVFVGAG
jgi:hypothetical protein